LEIKERKLPECDSTELAGKLTGGEGGILELRERLRERIRNAQEEERQKEMTSQILEHLDSQTTFELPVGVLAEETQRQRRLRLSAAVRCRA